MGSANLPEASDISRSCACFNLRKAARVVTQMYDERLRPSGIRATQFTILVAVQSNQPVSVKHLADLIVMDRTTLARNLKPLERNGLIAITPGEDRRVRYVALTDQGKAVLARALPLWKKTQEEFIQSLGASRMDGLLDVLSMTVSAFRPA
jgi:DNA-binding MarR family transcriptional regulator